MTTNFLSRLRSLGSASSNEIANAIQSLSAELSGRKGAILAAVLNSESGPNYLVSRNLVDVEQFSAPRFWPCYLTKHGVTQIRKCGTNEPFALKAACLRLGVMFSDVLHFTPSATTIENAITSLDDKKGALPT